MKKIRVLVAAVCCFGMMGIGSPASAGEEFSYWNLVYYGPGTAYIKGKENRTGMNVDLESMRVGYVMSIWQTQCDYKALSKVTIPNGYNYRDYSSYHSGCSAYHAYFDMPTGTYPLNSSVRGYWRSTDTGGSYKWVATNTLDGTGGLVRFN